MFKRKFNRNCKEKALEACWLQLQLWHFAVAVAAFGMSGPCALGLSTLAASQMSLRCLAGWCWRLDRQHGSEDFAVRDPFLHRAGLHSARQPNTCAALFRRLEDWQLRAEAFAAKGCCAALSIPCRGKCKSEAFSLKLKYCRSYCNL